ncbi:Rhamnolipids biosynthesis 3-oxoacyl-[acyl-carrier-protein] reductase [Verticillium dahliae VDG2]|nr:Rhamnolipids biosynthesis 3-oxoacyl-[acyl-carrier-protein] reductase [Verticillium dahliae VDG2]
MEHSLKCNVLKCRQEITDRALVTTCSHIFCIDCAGRSGLAGQSERRSSCPACNSNLGNPDDAVIAILSPSEEYKTSVLSGLSPNIIMECAGRALSFWAYQTTQEMWVDAGVRAFLHLLTIASVYQKYLEKTLTDKYKALDMHLDKTVNEANAEIESIQGQLRDLALQNDSMRRKYDELGQAFKDKSRKLLQTQELYDRSPRLDPVAEMGSQSLTAIAAGSDCLASSMTQPRIDRRNLGEPWESLHSNPVHLDVLDMSAISTAPGSVFDEADPPSNLQECRIPGETEDQSLNSLAGEVESLKQRLAEVMRLREREREQERCHRRDEQIQKERLHKEQLDHEREINAQRLIEMAQLHDEALLQANRDHADNLAEAVSQVTRKLEMERQALHAEDLLSVEAYPRRTHQLPVMATSPLKVAILIVSTTASKNPASDKSELVLRDVIESEGGGQWEVVETKIVSDHVPQIQRQIMLWADLGADAVNLIVTTGGTGFAVTDHTPEAVGALLHRQAPGIVHGMLATSLAVTPFAMMSRPVAGVRHSTVIVTLPGSPKGAKENLQAILRTLPHACLQAAGVDSRALHSGGVKKLEADAGIRAGQSASSQTHGNDHSHTHGHGHSHDHNHGQSHNHGHGGLVRHTGNQQVVSNDPSLGPTRRYRESPYPMLAVEDALGIIEQHTPEADIVSRKVDADLINAVLAEDVTANENVPAFRASIVDGYAVIVPKDGNMKGVYPVTAVSHAAPSEIGTLKEGEIARITTGAPLPPGATSVIMVEDTLLKTKTDDGKEEKEVEILADGVKPGENIREVGSDIKKLDTILRKGEQISGIGGEIGLLAAVGVASIKTYRRPVVGVLSTGDEIVEHDREGELRLGEVRDTNRVTLLAAAKERGFEAIDLGIARDRPGALEETLREALRKVDLLVTTGGVSMGELDLLKPTIERSLGGTIHFGRVDMKPGKPTTFATVPVKTNAGERVSKPVFALPGNPASALVTFNLFVLPALHKLAGVEPRSLSKVPVVLAHGFALDKGRPEYHRAVVTVGKDGVLHASSTGGQRSSRVGSLRSANALLCLPKGNGPLEKGAQVHALLMGGVQAEI